MQYEEIENICKLFNTIRLREIGMSYKKDEIVKLLSKFDLPKDKEFVSLLARYGALIKTGKAAATRYEFTNDPVLISTFRDICKALDEIRHNRKLYNHNYNKARAANMTEEGAIQFLKDLGYIIQKKVVTIIYETV